MKKKSSLSILCLFLILAGCVLTPLNAQDIESKEAERQALKESFLQKRDYSKEIEALEQSILAMKRWQKKYYKRQKSHEARARRMRFNNSTDGKKAESWALQDRENVLALQEKIEELELKKQELEAQK